MNNILTKSLSNMTYDFITGMRTTYLFLYLPRLKEEEGEDMGWIKLILETRSKICVLEIK